MSGPRGSGKTALCLQLVDRPRQCRLNCAGLISPTHFEGGRKVGIDLLDVRSSECRLLAQADGLPGELRTAAFRFDTEAVKWGAWLLNEACPCDVLIVDELGSLELERGQGWTNALDMLRSGQFQLAVVVVRPTLVNVFRRLMGNVPSLFQAESLFALPDVNVEDGAIHVMSMLNSFRS